MVLRQFVASLFAVCVVMSLTCHAGESSKPKGDAAITQMTLQRFDKVDAQRYPWGWIRWLMNDQIDPKAEMTFGVVYIKPHQTNPLHLHPGSTEYLHVIEGSCEHWVGDGWATLKAGDTLRIPRKVPHKARTGAESCRVVVVYSTGHRQFTPVEEK